MYGLICETRPVIRNYHIKTGVFHHRPQRLGNMPGTDYHQTRSRLVNSDEIACFCHIGFGIFKIRVLNFNFSAACHFQVEITLDIKLQVFRASRCGSYHILTFTCAMDFQRASAYRSYCLSVGPYQHEMTLLAGSGSFRTDYFRYSGFSIRCKYACGNIKKTVVHLSIPFPVDILSSSKRANRWHAIQSMQTVELRLETDFKKTSKPLLALFSFCQRSFFLLTRIHDAYGIIEIQYLIRYHIQIVIRHICFFRIQSKQAFV